MKRKKTSTRAKKETKKKRKQTQQDASGGHDRKSARKWERGGRIEAYTFGEAL